MREAINRAWPELTLERILEGLEQELIAASDEEIGDAARTLGMNPSMKGSAAFIGLRYARRFSLSESLDGFDPELLARLGFGGDAAKNAVALVPGDALTGGTATAPESKPPDED
jgi:hypothetical protein